MAVRGQGYFVVQKPTKFVDNRPVFDGVNLYTRRGDFQPDKNGYLVNADGYYLMGIPVDSVTGNAAGTVPQVMKFQNDFLPASKTTAIDYRANLASIPLTSAYDKNVPQSELLKASAFSVNPLIAGTGTVVGNDVNTFLKQTLSGGAITAYDSVGQPVNVQVRWAKVSGSAYGGSDSWQMFYKTDSDATGTQVAWKNAGQSFTFGSNGQLSPAVSTLSLTGVAVDGVSLGDLQVNFGAGGLTQFADTGGTVQVNQFEQNGFPAGNLQDIAVSDKGRLVGSYSNGRTIDLAEITLANFNGPEMLKHLDGGAFSETDESGRALFMSNGEIVASALEGSNTDIAEEFTKLIVTQQAYSANTRVVTTSNSMVQDLLSMLR
jgi:flagellar hook protein FlgE